MSALLSDLRSAVRQLRIRFAATVVSVFALALGIGGATAIFSVADATLIRALPYPRPEELVRVWETTPQGADFFTADPTFLDFRARTRAFAALAAMRERQLNLTGAGEPARLDAQVVSETLFPMLGVQAARGRLFTEAQERDGRAARVVVLSDALWRRRFGADPAIVGRHITLDGESYAVSGVLPADFAFAPAIDVWLPLAPRADAERDDHGLTVVGRMRAGVTLAQAHADLARVAREIAAEQPQSNAGWGVRLVSFGDWLLGPTYRRTVWVLFGAVGCLLLLACANVANLLVAQGVAREGEMGVRTAMGASRGRVVRQLFTESLVLALLGAAGGWLLAAYGIGALRALAPSSGPRLDDIALNGRVLGFALGVAVATAVLFGLLPALRTTRVSLAGMLSSGARAGGSARGRRVRDMLVVTQVALAMVLLVGAGLMLTSVRRLAGVDTGIGAEHVLTVPLQLSDPSYGDDRQRAFVRDLLTRTAALPGVRSAAVTTTNPFRQWGYTNTVTPAERAATAPPSGLLSAGWRIVTPDFFRTLGVPVLRGRAFDARDRDGAARVVIVSAALARQLWPGENAVGKGLFWGGTNGSPKEVVGVAGDVRDGQLDAAPPPMLYLPYDQVAIPPVTLLLRTTGDPTTSAAAVRNAVWAIDPTLPVPEVTPLAQNRSALVAAPRFRARLLASFAGAALLLAALGVYSVMAYAVAQRTREIGVRLTLGARPSTIAADILRRGLALTGAGVGLGLAGSVAAGRVAASLLYETSPTDAATLGAVTLLVVCAAVVATWLPSRRATRVDPARALKA